MMKRLDLFLPSLILTMTTMASCDNTPREDKVETSYSFLVGGYTDSPDQGIGLLDFDPENNKLDVGVIAPGISNPSFVLSNKAQSYVFAVEETGGPEGGWVKSYRFDRQKNIMELIDAKPSGGDHPCFLTLDPEERFLIVGNYSGGNFSVFEIKEGMLELRQFVQHDGQSINPDRQEKAHVHSTVFHPGGEYMLVGDLGTDKVNLYKFSPDQDLPFSPASQPYLEVDAGSGPRHLAVHPNGSKVYLIHELTAYLGVYAFENGKLEYVESFPLTASDFVGNISAAEVRVSTDGKHVYASNRGDANEISVFKILEDGNLEWVERVKSGGIMPRNFILTKDGRYLLAAHQASNNITVFERNPRTGKLTKLALEADFHKPVYFFGLD